MTASIVYTGDLRCQSTHLQSGSSLQTDAPTDNRGKGEKFSPTDLLCVSLGTCILTTMGIKAMDLGVDMKGATASVTKHMASDPRRVAKVDISITLPMTGTDRDRLVLEKTGDNCPVMKSIHPDIVTHITYIWQ
ncbi:MAG: OsmC family protein [Bacteroidota bacterium]|nr:OsmC family protein [Bacteroidota bacterium]